MMEKKYKVNEYGFYLRERLISFSIKKLNYACVDTFFEEKLLMSNLKFLEQQIHGNSLFDDERVYKQEAFKENLKKIGVIITKKSMVENNSVDKMKIKNIKISRGSSLFGGQLKNKIMSDEMLMKKVKYAQKELNSEDKSVKYTKVSFDMSNFFAIGLLDSQGIYDELLDSELKVHGDNFEETYDALKNNKEINIKKWLKLIKTGQNCKSQELSKKWLKKLITLELNVDFYKYFLTTSKNELEVVSKKNKDVYAYLAERFVLENGIKGICMILEDNQGKNFLDINSKIYLVKYLSEHKVNELFEERVLIDLIARETKDILEEILKNPSINSIVNEDARENLKEISKYFSVSKGEYLLASLSILNKSGKYGDQLLNLYNSYKGIIDFVENEMVPQEFYSLSFFNAARTIKRCVELFYEIEKSNSQFDFSNLSRIKYLTNEKVYFDKNKDIKFEYQKMDEHQLKIELMTDGIAIDKDSMRLANFKQMGILEDMFKKLDIFKALNMDMNKNQIVINVKKDEEGNPVSHLKSKEIEAIVVNTMKELNSVVEVHINKSFEVVSEQGFYQSSIQYLFDEQRIEEYTKIVNEVDDKRNLSKKTREEIDNLLQEIGVLIRTINNEKAFVEELMVANNISNFSTLISPTNFEESISKIKEKHLEYLMNQTKDGKINKDEKVKRKI